MSNECSLKSSRVSCDSTLSCRDRECLKRSFLYHGGKLYGFAADNTAMLAKTMLCVMVKCLMGGPEFLMNFVPIYNLNAEFLRNIITESVSCLHKANARVKVIISDGMRVNQKFVKNSQTVPNKPYLGIDGTFYLYDYVHLIKSIRNSWITEKDKVLKFFVGNCEKYARWEHLVQLYKLEQASGKLFKMSDLDHVSFFQNQLKGKRSNMF